MKRKFIVRVACFALVGCIPLGCYIDDTSLYRSYITHYGVIDRLMVSTVSYEDYVYYLYADFERCYGGPKGSTGEKIYEFLCLKHGDMSYNKREGGMPSRPAVGHDFVSIDITSDADYTEGYPAGSSLAPLAEFSGLTAMPYIASGYGKLYEGEYPDFYRAGNEYGRLYPVYGRLNELGREDMAALMISPSAFLPHFGAFRFVTFPDLSRSHDFTVTLTTDEGLVFTTTFHVDFISPETQSSSDES